MPIDTSSYYPEINDPEGREKSNSLNGLHSSLFGDKPSVKEEPIKEEVSTAMGPENEEQVPNKKQVPEEKYERIFTICSHILSWVLSPLLVPIYAILFIFRLSVLDVIPSGLQTAFTFIIAGINLCVPALLILLLKFLGVVSDLGLNERKERPIPYVITALCYGATAWFLASRGAPIWVSMFFTGGAAAALINFAINYKWKISAHAAAMAGLIALLIRLERDVAVEPKLVVWLLITIGATGLLGSARIWLGRHTLGQVLAGYLVGFCSVFFFMYIH